jgi:multiple sugar transport system ATP-binding protein
MSGAKESRIALVGAAKKFGTTIAVYPIDLEVKAGEFVVILGPSGCGKTTTLRMVAGLEQPSQGEVFIAGKDVTRMRPGERDVAFVFQMFSLYPHMTVLDNVAFPMRAQGLPVNEARRRASDMLRRLGIEPLAWARPGKLSGGDQQRVGLARALVREPKAFLMDEPLGSLDGGLREEMRETLRSVHNQAGATTLFVTHDQAEAMSLADRIAVMKDGRLIQYDHPRTIYDSPADLYVADFVGSPGMNIFRGKRIGQTINLSNVNLSLRVGEDEDMEATDGKSLDGDCFLGVRPQNVLITEGGAPCLVEHTQILGPYNLLSLRHRGGFFKAWLPSGVRFREGETVGVSFLTAGCRWFAAASGQALPWRTLEVACRSMV